MLLFFYVGNHIMQFADDLVKLFNMLDFDVFNCLVKAFARATIQFPKSVFHT
jgi:hypothetical protein